MTSIQILICNLTIRTLILSFMFSTMPNGTNLNILIVSGYETNQKHRIDDSYDNLCDLFT